MIGKNMRGFIFTLDAVFALIIASVGVSVLLYANFISSGNYQVPTYEAQSLLQNMLQTQIGSISMSSLYGLALYNSSQASAYTWPYFGRGPNLNGSAAFGISSPSYLWSFNAPGIQQQSLSVDKGIVAFSFNSNEIDAINATTGNVINGFPIKFKDTSTIDGAPLVYQNEIVYPNYTSSVVHINAVSITNGSKMLWSTNIGSAGVTSPMTTEGGLIVFTAAGTTVELLNPYNGTVMATEGCWSGCSGQVSPALPAYSTGKLLFTTTTQGSQNYLRMINKQGTQQFQVALSTTASPPAAITGNVVGVGSGTTLYLFNLNGTQIKTISLASIIKGLAAYGNALYAETANTIVGVSLPSGTETFFTSTPTQNWNATPSVTSSTLYTLISGYDLRAYNTGTSKLLWSINITGGSPSTTSSYSGVALAYGNAYVPEGNTMYVFGQYKPRQGDSILQTLAGLYLNGNGGLANLLLENIYNTTASNIGIFINSTYGPALKIADFNGASSCGNGYTTSPLNNKENFSIAAWVYPTSYGSSGTMIYSEGIPAVTSQFYLSSAGDLDAAEWNAGSWETSSSSFIIPLNRWSFVGVTLNKGSSGTGTVKFYDNGQAALQTTGQNESSSSSHYFGIGCNIGYQGSQPFLGFNGLIANLQLYNTTLSQSQISAIYSQGPYGIPSSRKNLMAWWPLEGKMNDYGPNYYTAIPSNVAYIPANFIPTTLQNSYQVSRASVPLSLNVNGVYNTYNVSVVVWR